MAKACDVDGESPLLREIATALRRSARARGVRVSVSRPEWFKPEDEDGRYWVKWLAWGLVDEKGRDFGKVRRAVAHGDLDERELRKALRRKFVGYKCVVDNDVVLE